jgi:hypothetical protein
LKAQTKLAAFWEAWQSTIIGFVLAWFSTIYIMPVCVRLWGIVAGGTAFTLWMTLLSFLRQWVMRMWNESRGGKDAPPDFRHIIVDIAAERNRQINGEGFTPDHDDEHTDRALASAAATYCYAASLEGIPRLDLRADMDVTAAKLWPNGWKQSWFKSTHHRRDLIKAAAMIVAEIGRLDRLKRRVP